MAPLDVLPPPLVKDNNATAELACFVGGYWGAPGRAEGQGFALRTGGADAGFATESAGATLKVRLGAAGRFVGVSYVRAPKGMGKALVACSGTCACDAHTLEGHASGDAPVVTHAQLRMRGSGGADCVIEFTAETARKLALSRGLLPAGDCRSVCIRGCARSYQQLRFLCVICAFARRARCRREGWRSLWSAWLLGRIS